MIARAATNSLTGPAVTTWVETSSGRRPSAAATCRSTSGRCWSTCRRRRRWCRPRRPRARGQPARTAPSRTRSRRARCPTSRLGVDAVRTADPQGGPVLERALAQRGHQPSAFASSSRLASRAAGPGPCRAGPRRSCRSGRRRGLARRSRPTPSGTRSRRAGSSPRSRRPARASAAARRVPARRPPPGRSPPWRAPPAPGSRPGTIARTCARRSRRGPSPEGCSARSPLQCLSTGGSGRPRPTAPSVVRVAALRRRAGRRESAFGGERRRDAGEEVRESAAERHAEADRPAGAHR